MWFLHLPSWDLSDPFFLLHKQGEASWAGTWEGIGKGIPWQCHHPQGNESTSIPTEQRVSLQLPTIPER